MTALVLVKMKLIDRISGIVHRYSIGRRITNVFLICRPLKSFLCRSIRTFTTALGPAGGKRGYAGITGHVSNGLAWYINGFLVPELWLRRGLTYEFKVRGGNNPHSPEYYHPLVITDEPRGGFDRLTEAKQNEIRVLAGVEFTRRGRPKPTAGK